MIRPVIVIGAGGHARVLIDALRLSGVTILFIVDQDPAKKGQTMMGIPVAGSDGVVFEHRPESALLVNGVGSVGLPQARREIFQRFKEKGYSFRTVLHPSAVVADGVELGEGAQVMAGAVIQTGASIGANAIVNTRASVDHDCCIAAHVHLAPGATVSGGVHVGEETHVGTAAAVIQGVSIGCNCLVAAGAVVIGNIADGSKVRGVPAREFV